MALDLNKTLQAQQHFNASLGVEIYHFFLGLIVLSSCWITIIFFKKMISCNKKLADIEGMVNEIEKQQNKKINNIISENALLIKKLNKELDFIKRQKSKSNKLSGKI